MLSLSPATRVFLALDPIDGRKSFNGLTTLVKESLGQVPLKCHALRKSASVPQQQEAQQT